MTDKAPPPGISVVVPAHNAGRYLDRCLAAIRTAGGSGAEIIVVDDASSDSSTKEITARHGARCLRLEYNRGPAVARNRGAAEAGGDIILFVDADVVLHPDTINQALAALDADAELAAVFGSYDDQPDHPAFLSQYRNLYHHWVHQQGSPDASTFWTGCGAVRRRVFKSLGGFDEDIALPAMEDIELGYRMRAAGHGIRLDRDMLCTHLKEWTLPALLRTDIFQRGIPWMVLLLRHPGADRDLNLNRRSQAATLAAAVFFATLAGMLLDLRWGLLALAAAAVIVWAQLDFYRYLAAIRGVGFAFRAIPAQILFFGCAAASIPLGLLAYLREKLTR